MDLSPFKHTTLFESDVNNREINLYKLSNVIITGYNCYYPNALLYCHNKIYNPLDEIILSLQKVKPKKSNFKIKTPNKICFDPVFYFIYNVENYYHFIYDTLPYLISYLKLKETIHSLKLLINYPVNQNTFYKFVTEFLSLLGIKGSDIIIVDNDTLYKDIFVSSSYTHGIDSSKPPRKEIYDFYKYIVSLISPKTDYPKKIYISRRTWINKDLSNIGTNYTTRRKLINEDKLVEILSTLGYTEVFTESMSTLEKIQLFSNAEEIIGPIGGGLVNVLFSSNTCKLVVLVSPTFLEVNERFRYSFSNVDTIYYTNCKHESEKEFKLYMRVQCDDCVGEIIDINQDNITISYDNNPIAGWNEITHYNTAIFNKLDCIKLDNGLNSPWTIDLKNLTQIL